MHSWISDVLYCCAHWGILHAHKVGSEYRHTSGPFTSQELGPFYIKIHAPIQVGHLNPHFINFQTFKPTAVCWPVSKCFACYDVLLQNSLWQLIRINMPMLLISGTKETLQEPSMWMMLKEILTKSRRGHRDPYKPWCHCVSSGTLRWQLLPPLLQQQTCHLPPHGRPHFQGSWEGSSDAEHPWLIFPKLTACTLRKVTRGPTESAPNYMRLPWPY